MMYKIDLEYLIPEFAAIELEAENEAEAEIKAQHIFVKDNPEAIDVTTVKVTKL